MGYGSAISMRQMSSAEALGELSKWNKDYLVGCIYTNAGTRAAFSVRRGALEVRDADLFLETETGKVLIHLSETARFDLADPTEMPFAQRMGPPSLSRTALKVVFPNNDVCLLFPEQWHPLIGYSLS
jgi:hypothetical protein